MNSNIASIIKSAKFTKEGVEITIEEGTTGIPYCYVMNYKYLIKVTLPDGLKTIGNYAFTGCSNLTTVELPEAPAATVKLRLL